MEQKRFIPRVGTIDHIEVQETERRVVNKQTGETVKVPGKTYLVYVVTAGSEFESCDPVPMFKFEGTHEKFLAPYKNLDTETRNDGRKIITSETILKASCPETRKANLKEDGKTYVGPDGTEYSSYGEYLLYMGTKGKRKKCEGCAALIMANVPISDGVQDWMRLDKDGKPVKRGNGTSIIVKNIDIPVVLSYDEDAEGFVGAHGTSPEEAVRNEVNNLIDRNRLRLIRIDEDEDEDEDDEK